MFLSLRQCGVCLKNRFPATDLSKFVSRNVQKYDTKRNLAQSVVNPTNSKESDKPDDGFVVIYKLKEIRQLSTLSQLKTYIASPTIGGLPFIGCFEYANIVPHQGTIVFLYVGLTMTALFSMVSIIFENTIGIIKYNKERDTMSIASINFWGKRVNEVIPVSDWVPLCDLPERLFTSRLYYTTQYLNSNKKRKLFCRDNYILNKKTFSKVVGLY